MTMAQSVLEVKGLIKDYGEFRAVDDVSFEIKKGQVIGLLGANGAGKSTTIQMLAGVTTPTAGTIRYFDQDFSKHRQVCLQRVNYASAYNTLQNHITAIENLRVFAALYGVSKPKQKIAELLDYFGIAQHVKQKYGELSAGERTRVNLVKALLNDPELILMDEPTASLDPDIADKTLSLIEELRSSRRLSILFTSHNMGEVSRICDQVIFLEKGRVVSSDTPSNHTKRLDRTKVQLRFKAPKKHMLTTLAAKDYEFRFEDEQNVIVDVPNSAVPALLSALHDAKIILLDIDIQKATLEDVFLHIARRNKS